MTVFDAEAMVRRYWTSPIVSPLLEAAKLARLMTDLCLGLTEAAGWTLYASLGFRRVGATNMDAVLTLLAKRIDRRERLGIPEVSPTFGQTFRKRGRLSLRYSSIATEAA